MNARDDLADASLDASLVAEVGDVFTTLSNDDASIFCSDEGPESESVLGGRGGRARVLSGDLC